MRRLFLRASVAGFVAFAVAFVFAAESRAGGLNPFSNDAAEDPDADGLDNLHEQSAKTMPDDPDSDDDGLTDGLEVNVHGTDPRRPDSDGDGLSDAAEINPYATDPLDADTDARFKILSGEEEAKPAKTFRFYPKVYKAAIAAANGSASFEEYSQKVRDLESQSPISMGQSPRRLFEPSIQAGSPRINSRAQTTPAARAS